MPVVYLLLAIFPGLLISWWIYREDTHEKEPHRILFWTFFLGVASTIPAIILEASGEAMGVVASENVFMTALLAFVVVAGSEELVKFLAVYIYPFKRNAFNEPVDGIVYSVMASMGFATLENILYVFELGIGTGLLRMFTAVPAHAAFGVVMGYYMGLAKFDKENRTKLLAKGLLFAILLHGAYDFFLFQENIPALALLAFVALGLGIRFSRKMIKEHQENSPFSEANAPVAILEDTDEPGIFELPDEQE